VSPVGGPSPEGGGTTGGAGAPRIAVRGLAKSFPVESGVLPVVDRVDLAAAAGTFVSIIGPSGCGKSTLFDVMAGLEPPDAGEVLVDGEVVTGRTDHVAYMPQQDLLFPWRRIIDNTTLGLEVQGVGRREARARASALFEVFGLSGFERAYPFELSGGMRQRAALLRTVVQDRRVLLLDEPFGALDSLTRTEMQAWLERTWERYQWTVLLVTHDVREAIFLSDRVVVLSPRPCRVQREVEVDLPRPRTLSMITSARFAALEHELLATLHGGAGIEPSLAGPGVDDPRARPARRRWGY
jgi:ABC-type nitrate/sulfonate/bicarbonate transport system ATPase subunit